MKAVFLSIFFIAQFVCCKSDEEKIFSDFVAVEDIENISMYNNSGEFLLSKKQLAIFKKQISSIIYAPNISAKVGAIRMTLIIEDKEYYMATSTHGEFVEIDYRLLAKNKSSLKSVFFKTNGINFDNYKKGE